MSDMDEFDKVALKMARHLETRFDREEFLKAFVKFVNAKLEAFQARELTSHQGFEARVGSDGFVLESKCVRSAPGAPLKYIDRDQVRARLPALSHVPGWDRAALALMGREKLFEKRWRALAKEALRQDALARDAMKWKEPRGLTALRERQALDESAKSAPSAPRKTL